MKISELFESPQNTFPTEFGLDDEAHNRQEAARLLSDNRKIALEKLGNGEATLYEFPRAFAVISHPRGESATISYIMKYEVNFHKFIGRQCAQQIQVWRKFGDPYGKDLAKRMFHHLISKYRTVITDSMQTDDGKRFWGDRLAEAFQDSTLHVYYVKLLPQREITELNSIKDVNVLMNNDRLWGDRQKFQAERVIITTVPFK